jgi:diadenosine tetraphosphate (Ap4A) HIT family hydrolase
MTNHDAKQDDCALCQEAGGELLWRDDFCRVVLVDDADYPGFCRVILNAHHSEMTDLPLAARHCLMATVYAVEQVLRDHLHPAKINLASFGNVVPHLHWHVVPRHADDRHFPNPVWGSAMRDQAVATRPALQRDVIKAALTQGILEARRQCPVP